MNKGSIAGLLLVIGFMLRAACSYVFTDYDAPGSTITLLISILSLAFWPKDAGGHDRHADPMFAQGRSIPYAVNEADVWNRKEPVSRVRALYRQRYAPAAASPLLNAGDPADGKGSYIGAIGPGKDRLAIASGVLESLPKTAPAASAVEKRG